MISKKIREEFEANYPMPFACGWNSMSEEYQCIWPEHAGEPDTEVPILEHNDRLAVWVKSRESILIQLPYVSVIFSGNEEFNDAVHACREAIEAYGLKVKP